MMWFGHVLDVVRSRTGQPLLSDTIRQRRLSFFGHLCRADTGQDHSQALRACIRGPPKDWLDRKPLRLIYSASIGGLLFEPAMKHPEAQNPGDTTTYIFFL